ncbi:hypothetical protein [Tritonibacter litoralis]|uniref:hypothetical protein n=1 Tax=Tritonibacter litoralis TaxID=2662264 RepID=UPI001FECF1CF|nr:hypothetical protein [Tritonibacter litoralis]
MSFAVVAGQRDLNIRADIHKQAANVVEIQRTPALVILEVTKRRHIRTGKMRHQIDINGHFDIWIGFEPFRQSMCDKGLKGQTVADQRPIRQDNPRPMRFLPSIIWSDDTTAKLIGKHFIFYLDLSCRIGPWPALILRVKAKDQIPSFFVSATVRLAKLRSGEERG